MSLVWQSRDTDPQPPRSLRQLLTELRREMRDLEFWLAGAHFFLLVVFVYLLLHLESWLGQ